MIDYRKKIKHIATITFFVFLFYAVLAVARDRGISITLTEVIQWLMFNDPIIIVGQMWFLFALLYDYLCFAFIEKLNITKCTLYLIPVLFLAYIVLAQVMYIIGFSIPNMYYRNWLIEGLLFFSIGYWIHRRWNIVKLSNTILIICIVICTFLCIAERIILGRDFGVNISTFPQILFIFLFCLKNSEYGKSTLLMKIVICLCFSSRNLEFS